MIAMIKKWAVLIGLAATLATMLLASSASAGIRMSFGGFSSDRHHGGTSIVIGGVRGYGWHGYGYRHRPYYYRRYPGRPYFYHRYHRRYYSPYHRRYYRYPYRYYDYGYRWHGYDRW